MWDTEDVSVLDERVGDSAVGLENLRGDGGGCAGFVGGMGKGGNFRGEGLDVRGRREAKLGEGGEVDVLRG